MKECKIIRINEGNPSELKNGNQLLIEELPRSENYLNGLLNDGWTLVHMMTQYNPNINREGCYNFFRAGYVYYLERETAEQPPTDKLPEPENVEYPFDEDFCIEDYSDEDDFLDFEDE